VRRDQAGFSLTELMVVVAIIGILSSVAVMSFRRYSVRVRVGEAYAMLGLIKAREEVYRAEFNQYASAPSHPAANPAAGIPQDWGTGGAVPAPWQQVGVRPDRDLYFVYRVEAGTPGADPPGGYPSGGAPPGYPVLDDFHFVASARSDIDGDGAFSYFELCSQCRAVWVDTTADFEGE
jgi:prepilin-type N-terminal cleavage/methylation domain-containing protein